MYLNIRFLLSRLFDYGLSYFIAIFALLMLPIEVTGQIIFLISVLIPLLWAPIEMVLLRTYHTTPGKILFGLKPTRFSWKECFKHAFCFSTPNNLLEKPIGLRRYLMALALAMGAGSALFLGNYIAEAAIEYEGQAAMVGWVKYTSDDGKFQVQFPKKPREASQTLDVPNEDPVKLSEFKAHKEAEFSVSHLDLPRKWRLFSSNTLLKGAMKAVLEHIPGSQILESRLVKHKDYPAMDFQIQEGENLIQGRLILVGNTLYKLWVVYFPDTPKELQHEPFLASFEVYSN